MFLGRADVCERESELAKRARGASAASAPPTQRARGASAARESELAKRGRSAGASGPRRGILFPEEIHGHHLVIINVIMCSNQFLLITLFNKFNNILLKRVINRN